uniref:Vacuolar iron transporter n=1 Tax=Oryza punctata TaxID=4537 RepID=A0A0E0LRA8_ORYPU
MAMQMNSVVHVSTSPTSPPPEGKQEHREVAAVHVVGVDDDEAVMVKDEEVFGGVGGGVDYSGRAQWLRAAVLGANDGLVSVASLMIGVGAVNESARTMLVSGVAGLVAGACSMAIGEFVSVYAQYDIEVAAARRRRRQRRRGGDGETAEKVADEEEEEESRLPSPFKAAAASALAFTVGALLPLLAGGFIRPWVPRVAAVCATTSAALAGFGAFGAVLGGASPARSAARVLLGGWAAMAACYGVLRLFANLY